MHRKKFVFIIICYGVVSIFIFLHNRLKANIIAHPRKNEHAHLRAPTYARTYTRMQPTTRALTHICNCTHAHTVSRNQLQMPAFARIHDQNACTRSQTHAPELKHTYTKRTPAQAQTQA